MDIMKIRVFDMQMDLAESRLRRTIGDKQSEKIQQRA